MIFVIDDDLMMAECIVREAGVKAQIFTNGIEAIQALDECVPDLIFLDILLDGPDGFSVLNELSSYNDTEKIPVVIVTSLNLEYTAKELLDYGVVKVLKKDTMMPEDIKKMVKEYTEL